MKGLKMKRRVMAVVACMVMALSVAGCGESGGSDDSAKYVQGVLDIAYQKGMDAYVEAAGVSEEDAKKYEEQAADAQAKVMAAYFGIEEPSGDVLDIFKGCYKELCDKYCSYEVEASDNGVIVKVKPVKIGSDKIQEYIDEYNVKQFVDGDASCTDEAFAKEVTGRILAEQEAGSDETSVEVAVTEKDGKYSVSDEDLGKIDAAVIQYQ